MTELNLRIAEDDLAGEAVRALIAFHLEGMHANSPACHVHALPAEKLREPGVTFYAAWAGETLAGMGALKELAPDHGELKSMRAAPGFVGLGVGRAMLLHLLAEARARGYVRVSLETGRGPAFEPAQGLYRAHGFVECGAFADYEPNEFSCLMTLAL